jgi:hypothetical protein
MKRLAVGLAVLCLTATMAGVTGSAPAGAVVAAPTTVYTANAYSYAANHPFTGTFCVDGSLVSTVTTGQVDGIFDLPSGPVTVDFFNSETTCGDMPTASADVVLPAGGNVTLMAYWPDGGPHVAMLPNTLDCVAAGTGRLTVRNGARTNNSLHVDIWGMTPGGVDTKLLSDIASGAQATTDLPVGTYTDVRAVLVGTTTLLDTIGTVSNNADVVTYEYLYGGSDGDVGSFFDSAKITTCAVATTTTTAAPAKPAAVVQAAPAFTG